MKLTTTERRGRREVEQPQVGPVGARLAGASESKDTENTEENSCECDNTHKQNNTCCTYCWDVLGQREWSEI